MQAKERLSKQLEHYLETLPDDQRPGAERVKAIHVCESHPVDEILEQSEKLRCDLIVMGTHDYSVVGELLGSVAHKVVHRHTIPVLLVPLRETKS